MSRKKQEYPHLNASKRSRNVIRRLFHRFVDPEAADADSQDCDYSLQVLRSRIALKVHDDWRRELVEAGELGQFFGVSLDLVFDAGVRVPADSVESRGEQRNDSERRANGSVSGPNES